MIIILSSCNIPIKTYYFGTENLRQKDCSQLIMGYWFCTVTHVDNKPTNVKPHVVDQDPPRLNRTIFSVKPGNHFIKYSYSYKIYLMSDNSIGTWESYHTSPSYFHKDGVINFYFKKGKKYTLIVDDETSQLVNQKHDAWEWESICNKYISVFFR
jgi:hypothetical protein